MIRRHMDPFGREITGMLEIHLSYVGRVLGKRNQEKLEQRFGEKVHGRNYDSSRII